MPGAHQVQLAIHCKKTEAVDLKSPLVAHIRATYTDREAEEASDDVSTIQQLRAEIALAQNGAQPALRDNLAKYIRCLTAIETRFPISKEKVHAQIQFVWFDAFRPAKRQTQHNVHFEKASVLFNLAAVMSQQAIACDRTTPEGLKLSCQAFQEAAGTFAYLKDTEANKTDLPRPQDLSPECVTMLEKLMLAQAQEAMYNKCIIEGKTTPKLLSRLAKQTSIMYAEVEHLFAGPALLTYFDKSWLAHTQLKASLYDVETLVRMAQAFRAEDEVATEICVLREAFKRIQKTKALGKAISADMLASATKMQDAMQLAFTKAEKDNATIYLKREPAFLDVPQVQGALLVKSVPPTNLDASQDQHLFVGLVPDTSAKALSKYTDMVDALIREQVDHLASATDTARLRLTEWGLPEALEALDVKTNAALPGALLMELEEIESIGGASHLKGIMAEIGDLRRVVDEDLRAALTALDGDQTADAACRAKYGERWTSQMSSTLAKPYWDRIATYRASMQKAADSDQGVMKRMADSDSTFSNLRIDAAAMQMPRLQAPLMNTGPEDPARIVANLRRNLETLQTLAAERAGIEEALKDMKKKDNVLPKLMACTPHAQDALFASEVKKYDAMREAVTKNCRAQDELLAAVDRDNKAFRYVFDTNAWRQACDAAAVGIREQVRLFRELLDHLSEGLRFYIGMSEVVKKACQECSDFAFTRQVQREETTQDLDRRAQQEESEKVARQLSQANLHAQQPTNQHYPQAPGGGQQQQQAPPPQQQHAPPPAYGQPSSQTYGQAPSQPYGQQTPHQAYYGAPQASQPAPHYGYGGGQPSSPQQYAPPPQQQQYAPLPQQQQQYAPPGGYNGYAQPPAGYPTGAPPMPQHGQQQYGAPQQYAPPQQYNPQQQQQPYHPPPPPYGQ